MEGQSANGPAPAATQPGVPHQGQPAQGPAMGPEEVDRLVKQRLEQAFHGVFRRLIDTSERAAQAAEASAATNRLDGLTKSLKVEQWKPTTREEELKTWKEWAFQFTNWLVANDRAYEDDLESLDLDKEVDHDEIPDAKEERSQRLFGVLCNVLKGRPLLLVRQMAARKNGLEAWRMLKREMEPREKARSLALVRQLAAWKFDDSQDLHSQLVRYEEALRTYESSSGKAFPEELVLATVVTGLREPLKSQVQLQMQSSTRYAEVREWILRYESLNTPWSTSLGTKGSDRVGQGGPQPMEIDVIKGKGRDNKGKDGKGKNGGKGKDSKGKDGKGKKGKPGEGKGWQANLGGSGGKPWGQPGGGWSSQWGNQGWSSQSWSQPSGKGKSKKGLDPAVCALCWKGHWKNECPQKGKGKVNQIEQGSTPGQSATSSSASTAASSIPSSASALKAQAGHGVYRVETFACETPRNCRCTEVFDMTELDDEEGDFNFGLAGAEVMVIECKEVVAGAFGNLEPEVEPLAEFEGITAFPMDATDDDGEWTLEPGLAEAQGFEVLAVQARTEVVIDSGADISVAPLRMAHLGQPAKRSGILMQDAQGKRIPEKESRVLEIEMETLENSPIRLKEKFCIAPVSSIIVSMGRLLRWGWSLGTCDGKPVIERGGHQVPIRLRRNTLTILATVASIAATTCAGQGHLPPASQGEAAGKATGGPRQVNMMTFDDLGRLPPQAEELVGVPGWHILPSGLPLFVAHRVEEVNLEQSLWSGGDWAWLALFVRVEPATRLPEVGDVWIQALTAKVEDFETAPKTLDKF